uniref:NADH-ubiquinone oxidoreductase chain 2 n=1 Tax=Chinolyda flagellicornis TaxID=2492400 RepID=A0A3G8FWC7_9HYME|nr:NADH dehydrogenase subunit 2 [Chinolyda flagellicornis]
MMNYNSTKLMFLILLMMSTILSISSYSWFSMWMGLEMNLMAFIMIMSNYKNMMNSESSIKYFMVQALTSTIFLSSIIMLILEVDYNNVDYIMKLTLNLSLMIKMGAAPFHLWFIQILNNMNWMSCLILMTWQKISPMIILSYFMNNYIIILIMMISIITGSIGGINQSFLRTIMGYSSINNLGWLLMCMMISETLWNFYFIMYSMLNMVMIFMFNSMKMFHINQSYSINNIKPLTKFLINLNILSLGGLPPFLGFLPKWMTLKMMLMNNMIFYSLLMMMMSLITLYYYLQINFSSMMLNYYNQKFNNNSFFNKNMMNYLYMLTFLSMTTLSVSSMMFNF